MRTIIYETTTLKGTPGGKKIDTLRKFSLLLRSQSAPNPFYSSL
jgi:hypothetical protein